VSSSASALLAAPRASIPWRRSGTSDPRIEPHPRTGWERPDRSYVPRDGAGSSTKGGSMTLDVLKERGTPLERQERDWRDLVRVPYSKLDDDAMTRVRVILMNGIESEAIRFSHAAGRMNHQPLQKALAIVRRAEQHQQTLVNWLNPPDQDPLETTLGFEQVAVEVTAAVALAEPDPYMKGVYEFGLLE